MCICIEKHIIVDRETASWKTEEADSLFKPLRDRAKQNGEVQQKKEGLLGVVPGSFY